METLETKAEKIDWKQWIPYYGLYKAIKSHFRDEPSLCDLTHPLSFVGSMYHGIWDFGLLVGISYWIR